MTVHDRSVDERRSRSKPTPPRDMGEGGGGGRRRDIQAEKDGESLRPPADRPESVSNQTRERRLQLHVPRRPQKSQQPHKTQDEGLEICRRRGPRPDITRVTCWIITSSLVWRELTFGGSLRWILEELRF